MTPKQFVLKRYPNAVCRKSEHYTNVFFILRDASDSKYIGIGMTEDAAWSDAAENAH